VARKIISPQQWGFNLDRNISEYVIIASVAINVLSKKGFAGNLALKIHITKAFDSLDWIFLLEVSKQFDFYEVFVTGYMKFFSTRLFVLLIESQQVFSMH
jgi:hypothetical protein